MGKRRVLVVLVATAGCVASCDAVLGVGPHDQLMIGDEVEPLPDATTGDEQSNASTAPDGGSDGDAGVVKDESDADAEPTQTQETSDASADADAEGAVVVQDAGCDASANTCSGATAIACVGGKITTTNCTGNTPTCLDGQCVQCQPPANKCASTTQPMTCNSADDWVNATACSHQWCQTASGTCGGVCGPGDVTCSGQYPETCDGGSWVQAAACPANQTCLPNAGSCGGVCGPTQTQCANNIAQTCVNGAWSGNTECTSPTPFCIGGTCKAEPPSCAPGGNGMTDCGPGESCCTSLPVAGGNVFRTYSNNGSSVSGEADPATVSNFRLDKYDVTVGRFRQFVAAWNNGSGYYPPAGSGKHTHLNGGNGLVNADSSNTAVPYEQGWSTSWNTNVNPTNANLACTAPKGAGYASWTNTAGSQENLPITCVNWYEAYAFCIWDGGFLPSEAEWVYVAAGSTNQWEYAWGNTAPGTSNDYAIYGCYYPNGSGTCTGVANLAPVGHASSGGSHWGQLDMNGNIWKWTLDWLQSPYADPCTNCAWMTAESARTNHGANFFGVVSNVPSWERYGGGAPVNRDEGVGFRCARVP